jgi:hypothetical protein
MEEPLVNRVQESGLIQVDLASLLAPPPVSEVDLAAWLSEGAILRERAFREAVDAWDATGLTGHVVALECSVDAILADWAWMLVAAKLTAAGAHPIQGTRQEAETLAWRMAVNALDLDTYRNERVIVKGCATAGGPATLVAFTQRVTPVVRSLMFGEACSSVPLVKNPRP